jgi:hypothetical protein
MISSSKGVGKGGDLGSSMVSEAIYCELQFARLWIVYIYMYIQCYLNTVNDLKIANIFLV